MKTLQSLEKLRTAAKNMAKGSNLENHDECNLLLIIADEIQAEVDERFMALPLDADDMPIHCGDTVQSLYSRSGIRDVFAVNEYSAIARDEDDCLIDIGRLTLIHVKPRTLEDVLQDRINDVLHVMTSGIPLSLETALNDSFGEECADEIRELMKEGGE